jgi:hypothetical protein
MKTEFTHDEYSSSIPWGMYAWLVGEKRFLGVYRLNTSIITPLGPIKILLVSFNISPRVPMVSIDRGGLECHGKTVTTSPIYEFWSDLLFDTFGVRANLEV